MQMFNILTFWQNGHIPVKKQMDTRLSVKVIENKFILNINLKWTNSTINPELPPIIKEAGFMFWLSLCQGHSSDSKAFHMPENVEGLRSSSLFLFFLFISKREESTTEKNVVCYQYISCSAPPVMFLLLPFVLWLKKIILIKLKSIGGVLGILVQFSHEVIQ